MQSKIINQHVKTFTCYLCSVLLFASIFITQSSNAIPSLPIAPSSFTATSISTTQINLSWTDNSSDETGFKIQQPAGTSLTITAANTTSYSHTGLSCGTTYNYTLNAMNVNGDSLVVTATATTAACAVSAPVGFDFNKPAKVFTTEKK